ncbi:MAG: grasp-with-spasm system ATP-grasp peptide maturase [Cyclobacteriaceae bacterium]
MANDPILIMSIDQDPNTTEVMRWLLRYGEHPVRINEHDQPASLSQIEDGEVSLQLGDGEIPLKDFKSYWYRRGNWQHDLPDLTTDDEYLKEESDKFLKREKSNLQDYLHYKLKEIPHLSDYSTATGINKDIVLDEARACGLLVPPTLITGSKDKVTAFMARHEEIVTKAMRSAIRYYTREHWLPMYTEEVTDGMLQELPDTFGVSLFQKKIAKRYEIRSFFLEDEYYSMAIFSQKDAQTSTDFRRYKHEKPNRNVPFTLPDTIRKKLQTLMEKVGLNTGSVDLLVTPEGRYYFLEVNPIGQFGMTSYPCNYFLERRIAQYLKDGK